MSNSDTGEPTLAWSKTSNKGDSACHADDGSDQGHTGDAQFDAQRPGHKPLPAGTMIDGRYEVISVIGRGGCGSVYRVRQMVMGKVLALKTLNPSTSRVTVMRLQKEAQALSRLEHPNIVQAFDFGMLGEDQPFFVMECVNGPTLGEYLKQQGGKLSLLEVVELFVPICQALSYANERGVVHRDIKPSNIILAEDVRDFGKFAPKLVDFGIAKIQFGDESAATLTRTGEIFGTPLYMSPEQCLGNKIDHRSDIYSLGCVMFQALTGRPPYGGASPIKTMMEHSSADVPSLKESSPDDAFPLAMEQLIASMLAKKPADRLQNFKQVQEALLLVRESNQDSLPASLQSGGRGTRRATASALIALVALLVVATAAGIVLLKPFDKVIVASKKSSSGDYAELHPASALLKLATTEGDKYVADSTYFSSKMGDGVVFKFPKKMSLGTLKFWTAETEKREVPAKGTVTVPGNSKRTLFVDEALVYRPALWSKFRPEDLYGVRIDFSTAFSSEGMDNAVDTMMQISREQHAKTGHLGLEEVWERAKTEVEPNSFNDSNLKAQNLNGVMGFDNLHLLALLFADFNERSWLHMGTLPNLRWVWLDACRVNGAKPRGESLAKLTNLNNLRVLSIDRFEAPAAMLAKLSKSKELKRLSLGVVPLTKQDLSMIAEITNLDTLRLRELTLSKDARFDQLAAAPHLERLALDQVSMTDTSILSGLVKLKNLKELVVDFPEDSMAFNSIRVVPGCTVSSRPRARTEWFDWTKENPDVSGLW